MNANDFPLDFLRNQEAERNARLHKPSPSASGVRSNLLFKGEVYQIISCALEVLNELGHGLNEKPYENALVVEFGLRKISFTQQRRYHIEYKAVTVGEYTPDLIAFDTVVVMQK